MWHFSMDVLYRNSVIEFVLRDKNPFKKHNKSKVSIMFPKHELAITYINT